MSAVWKAGTWIEQILFIVGCLRYAVLPLAPSRMIGIVVGWQWETLSVHCIMFLTSSTCSMHPRESGGKNDLSSAWFGLIMTPSWLAICNRESCPGLQRSGIGSHTRSGDPASESMLVRLRRSFSTIFNNLSDEHIMWKDLLKTWLWLRSSTSSLILGVRYSKDLNSSAPYPFHARVVKRLVLWRRLQSVFQLSMVFLICCGKSEPISTIHDMLLESSRSGEEASRAPRTA